MHVESEWSLKMKAGYRALTFYFKPVISEGRDSPQLRGPTTTYYLSTSHESSLIPQMAKGPSHLVNAFCSILFSIQRD
jgi:hypothetical protein